MMDFGVQKIDHRNIISVGGKRVFSVSPRGGVSLLPNVRVPYASVQVLWNNVLHKPATFPPSPHSHTIADITNIGSASVFYAASAGAVDWPNVTNKPATFPPSVHGHTSDYIIDAESLIDHVGNFVKMLSDGSYLASPYGPSSFEPAFAAGTTAQYRRGDKTWQTLNQAAVDGLRTTDSPTFAGVTITGGVYVGGGYIGPVTRKDWENPTGGLNSLDLHHRIVYLDGYGGPVPNAPDGGWWEGAVTIGNNTRGIQIAGSYSGWGLYFRKGQDSGVWTDWTRILNTQNDIYPSNMDQHVRSDSSPTFAALTSSGDITVGNEVYLDNGKYLRFKRSSGGLSIQTLGIESGTDNVRLLTSGDFYLRNGSLTSLLHVTNAGNATFSGETTVFQNSGGANLYVVRTSNRFGMSADNTAVDIGARDAGDVYLMAGAGVRGLKLQGSDNTIKILASSVSTVNLLALKESNFGYNATYKVLQLGESALTKAISIGVDLTGNASGSFTGDEIIFPYNKGLITPNATNDSYRLLIKRSTDYVRIGGNDFAGTLGAQVYDDGLLYVQNGATMTGGWKRTLYLDATFPTIVFNSYGQRWASIGYDFTTFFYIRVGATSADTYASGTSALAIDALSGAAYFGSSVIQEGNYVHNVYHGNNASQCLPSARNSGGSGDAWLRWWVSEPGQTWTGAGIARNMTNTTGWPRINSALTGQMINFAENGEITFTIESIAGTRTYPFTISNSYVYSPAVWGLSAESFRLVNDNAYVSWYNSSNSTRRGYIQHSGTFFEFRNEALNTKYLINAVHEFHTAHGSVTIGAQNTAWAHFDTDRPNFYFSTGIGVNGSAFRYGYTSGILGQYWSLSDTHFEIDNITVRNAFRTHIFQKDVARVSNALFFVSDAGIVVSATGTTIKFRNDKSATFTIGTQLWIKDVPDAGGLPVSIKLTITDNGTVSGNGIEYTCTYTEGVYTDITAGMTAMRTNGGVLLLDASSVNSPFMDVAVDGVVKTRIGRLDGIAGMTGYGMWASNGTDGVFHISTNGTANIAGWNFNTKHLWNGGVAVGNLLSEFGQGLPSAGFGNWNDGSRPILWLRSSTGDMIEASNGTSTYLGFLDSSASVWNVQIGELSSFGGSARTGFALQDGSGIVFEMSTAIKQIAGWAFDTVKIYKSDATGTLDGSTYTTTGMVIGSAGYIAAPKFRVSTAGVLYAVDVDVTGSITANAGAIAGWSIDSLYMWTGTKQTLDDYSSAGITIAAAGSIRAKEFLLTSAGAAKFKGLVEGAVISGGSLSVGALLADGAQDAVVAITSDAVTLKILESVASGALFITPYAVESGTYSGGGLTAAFANTNRAWGIKQIYTGKYGLGFGASNVTTALDVVLYRDAADTWKTDNNFKIASGKTLFLGARELKETDPVIVNVKMFGAVGDGSTNDTAAIVAAIAALNATYGGTVYFPPGKYLTDKITVIKSNVKFVGEGSESSILKLRTSGGSTQLLYLDGNNYLIKNITIESLGFEGSNPTTAYTTGSSIGTEEGIHIASTNGANGSNTTRNIVIRDCAVYGFNKWGVYAKDTGSHDVGRNSDGVKVYNLRLHHNYYGIYLDTYAEYNQFFGIDAFNNRYGGYMNSGNNLWTGCQFNQNVTGFYMYGGANNAHGGFTNCQFNHNSYEAFYADSVTAGEIFTACFFFEAAMTLINCDRLMFSRCYFVLTSNLVLDANTLCYIADSVFWGAYGGTSVTKQNSDTTRMWNNYWYAAEMDYTEFKKINTPHEVSRIRGFETDDNPGTGDLTANAKYDLYMKNNKFVIAYNNAGTMNYITIPMDGSTNTWTHSSTAP